MSVLERLGAALCELVPRHLPSGVSIREGRTVLLVPRVDYDGLTDTMFHMIRQNADGSAAILIRILEVLIAVVSCEVQPKRVASLQRHADLVLTDGERTIETPSDLLDLRMRHRRFAAMRSGGPAACIDGLAS